MFINQRFYTVLNLLVLTALIYSGVDIFYTVIGSKVPDNQTQIAATETAKTETTRKSRHAFQNYQAAIEKQLFGVPEKELSDTKVKEFDVEALERAALRATLLGTVSGNAENAVAVIQEGTKRTQGLYKEGDTIQNATILKILRGQVVLKVGDKNQVLKMEENPTGSASRRSIDRSPRTNRAGAGRQITLNRSDVSKSLDNITELMSQVRVRPHYKNGKPDGLILSQIKPNSVVTKMGLRNGDVVQQVNGKPVTSAGDVTQFYQELKSGSSVSLDISRRGRSETINYTFR